MSPREGWQELEQDLNQLAGQAEQKLQALENHKRWRNAFMQALPVAVSTLAVFAFAQLLGRIGKVSALQFTLWPWVALATVLWLIQSIRLQRRAAQRADGIARQRALHEWDQQLHLADRLATADEFLHQEEPTPFMQAAMDDARAHAAKSRQASLLFAPESTPPRLASPLLAMGMCLVVGFFLGNWQSTPVVEEPGISVSLPGGSGEVQEKDPVDESNPPPVQAQMPQKPKPERKPSVEEANAETHAANREAGQDERSTKGDIGSGRSSAAESSTGAGNAQGTPSKQGQISKPGERKTGSSKPKPPKPRKEESGEPPKKNEEQESGSTAGRGSSRGSNRNPAASDWASKDHVNTPDDQDLEDENEVDDEDEEQESRGGMQPTMRDRKPPVSRDLSIGFGNQPSPDAKGRGGPSTPKKSRGTASLVLGVPIPDRVKGQPNQGKTKITQERVQPQAEPAKPGIAQERLARVDPASALRRDPLAPWMSRIVRDYFLQRSQSER
jgi:hypothetical protein